MKNEWHYTTRLSMVDPCTGSISRSVLLYALPVLGTSLFQLTFNAADLIVVGRLCGSDSIAAIGATMSAIHLLVNCFIGLSVGAGVVASQACGAKNQKKIYSSIQTSIPMSLAMGIVLGLIGNLFVIPILSRINVPENIEKMSAQYMRIIFFGSAFNLLYNFSASILRATGDSKHPMLYLIFSGVVNVILNVFCIKILRMDVDGVAWSTVASQALSSILTTAQLYKTFNFYKFKKSFFHVDWSLLLTILRIGCPVSVQSMTFAMANVVVQSAINQFGSDAISGSAAAANIESFVCTGMSALQQTAVVFVGQNYGGKKRERVLESYKVCRKYAILFTTLISVLTLILSRQLLEIYISDSLVALKIGSIRLKYIVGGYVLCAIVYVCNGFLQGLGKSTLPMITSLLGICGFRIAWLMTAFHIPSIHNIDGLFCVFPISYLLTAIMLIIMVKAEIRKIKTEGINDFC